MATAASALKIVANQGSYQQFENDWEQAVAVAPSEARAAAEDSLSVARDFTALAISEDPPDEKAWSALVDRGERAPDDLQDWSSDNCSEAAIKPNSTDPGQSDHPDWLD